MKTVPKALLGAAAAAVVAASAVVLLPGGAEAEVPEPGLWVTSWFPASVSPAGRAVSGDGDRPRLCVNGDHFTAGGDVRIVFTRRRDHRALHTFTTTAVGHDGFPGGSFGFETDVPDGAFSTTPIDAWVAAEDVATGRWSPYLPVSIGLVLR